MEIKTIEQIKEEVAKEFLQPYRSWIENARFSNDDNISVLEDSGAIDEAMTRYASQFQTNTDLVTTEICVLRERVAELEDGLKDCAWTLHRVLDTTKPDSDWATFTTSIVDIISLAESLINKGNDTSV